MIAGSVAAGSVGGGSVAGASMNGILAEDGSVAVSFPRLSIRKHP